MHLNHSFDCLNSYLVHHAPKDMTNRALKFHMLKTSNHIHILENVGSETVEKRIHASRCHHFLALN